MKSVSIVGEGAWGTAIAQLLADNNYQVTLWCYDQSIAQEIATNHTNTRYMSGVRLHTAIVPVTDFASVTQHNVIFISTPVQYLRSVLEQLKPYYLPHHLLVMLNKGIENNTLLFPTQIVADVLNSAAQQIVVSGPSFAKEVIAKCLTGMVVASKNAEYAQSVQQMLSNSYMRLYVVDDVLGIQVAAALKNVIALAVGIAHGAGFCANTKAFLMTRGLHEMTTLALFLGGNAQTIYGLAGVGDLILTATNITSKNYQVGVALGQGKKLNEVLAQTGYIPEGVNTARSVYQLCQRHQIVLPICQTVYRFTHENGTVENIRDAIKK